MAKKTKVPNWMEPILTVKPKKLTRKEVAENRKKDKEQQKLHTQLKQIFEPAPIDQTFTLEKQEEIKKLDELVEDGYATDTGDTGWEKRVSPPLNVPNGSTASEILQRAGNALEKPALKKVQSMHPLIEKVENLNASLKDVAQMFLSHSCFDQAIQCLEWAKQTRRLRFEAEKTIRRS